MSFTQKQGININPKQVRAYVCPGAHCDGCNVQCELGYEYASGGHYYIYPTIGSQVVSSYINENYKMQYTGDIVKEPRTSQQKFQQELCAKVWAGKIAKLCDHYKTR